MDEDYLDVVDALLADKKTILNDIYDLEEFLEDKENLTIEESKKKLKQTAVVKKFFKSKSTRFTQYYLMSEFEYDEILSRLKTLKIELTKIVSSEPTALERFMMTLSI